MQRGDRLLLGNEVIPLEALGGVKWWGVGQLKLEEDCQIKMRLRFHLSCIRSKVYFGRGRWFPYAISQ